MPERRGSTGRKRLGTQPRRHLFFLNPYSDARFTTCPKCSGRTRLRKLPLVIHVEPLHLLVLNKTCRYCPFCDLVIAHQDELEAQLAALFTQRDPEAISNDYLVLGSVDRSVWQRGREEPLAVQDAVAQVHEFKQVLQFEFGPRWGPA